jgi:hypothetical protein
MTRALLVMALLGCSACYEDQVGPSQSDSERRLKEKAQEDAILKAHLQKGPPQPLRELNDFDVMLDAGTLKQSAAPKPLPELPKPLGQPDGALLVKAWRDAKSGDFVTVQCAHFISLYGNRVRRRVQLRLEVAEADDRALKLRVRGGGVEEHDSTNPATKRKHWTADFHGAAELVMQRAPDEKLGAAQPARNLSDAVARVIDLGAAKIEARCAESKGSVEVERKERCIATETARLYLTAGLVSELGPMTNNGCKVTGFGNTAPAPHLPSDVDATQYSFTERGGAKFRERAASAAGGMVRTELQRLKYVRAPEAGSVSWDGRNFAPGLVDTRKQHVLDWALQRVMPEYPEQLATD